MSDIKTTARRVANIIEDGRSTQRLLEELDNPAIRPDREKEILESLVALRHQIAQNLLVFDTFMFDTIRFATSASIQQNSPIKKYKTLKR